MQSHNAAASNKLPLSSWEPRAEKRKHTFQGEGARMPAVGKSDAKTQTFELYVNFVNRSLCASDIFVLVCPFCVSFPFKTNSILEWNFTKSVHRI
jgi:hypothetical protein